MTEDRTTTDSQDRGRGSARRKTEAVLRLLRGEDLGTLSHEPGVVSATHSSWPDAFLDGGRDEPIWMWRARPGARGVEFGTSFQS